MRNSTNHCKTTVDAQGNGVMHADGMQVVDCDPGCSESQLTETSGCLYSWSPWSICAKNNANHELLMAALDPGTCTVGDDALARSEDDCAEEGGTWEAPRALTSAEESTLSGAGGKMAWINKESCTPNGKEKRERKYANDCKEKKVEKRACNSCDNDYTCWESWGDFGACEGPCKGTSEKVRTRKKAGACTATQTHTAWCVNCPDSCWNSWSEYTDCGHCRKDYWQIRQRSSQNACKGFVDKERKLCTNCPADCFRHWGQWSATCGTEETVCGVGTRTRNRGSWHDCREDETEVGACPCGDECWNAWSDYVGHEGACGVGTKLRARGSRNLCKGETAQTQTAAWDPGCPLDGLSHCWQTWGAWGECSARVG